MLSVGHYALSPLALAILVVLIVAVAVLLIASRFYVKKSYMSDSRNVKIKVRILNYSLFFLLKMSIPQAGTCTPDDEADQVQDTAIYCVAAAAVLEGICFALYTSITAGNDSHLRPEGFYTKNVLLQVLRFTSITLLAIHRVFRPANRIDPMRTMLEVRRWVCHCCLDSTNATLCII